MLTQEGPESPQDRGEWKPLRPGVAALLALVVGLVLFLRHDFWNWNSVGPKLFGVIPVGLWWQGLVSLCASGMMWLLVRFAWPGWLEREAELGERKRIEGRRD